MKIRKTFLLVLLVGLMLTPAPSRSETYFGAYLGGNFSSNFDPEFDIHPQFFQPRIIIANRTARNVSMDPAFIVGGKIGHWFTRERVFGLNMPKWLKYFGFELDLSYHSLSWPNQSVRVDPLNRNFVLENDGSAITMVFLFMGRYGFLKDSEVPFGRLQPYIGIGPIVFFSTQKLNIGQDFQSTEADVGLGIESGIRYMFRKNVSLNIAFRYRYVPNHLDVDDTIFDQPVKRYVVMRTKYNLYDIIFGIAYHFH